MSFVLLQNFMLYSLKHPKRDFNAATREECGDECCGDDDDEDDDGKFNFLHFTLKRLSILISLLFRVV